MRSIVTCFILICCGLSAMAQTKPKLTYSASLNPSATFPINTSSSSAKVSDNNNQTYSQYADSVRSFETYKLSLGLTVWATYPLGRSWNLQFGLGYNETGFTRQQRNIKFNDHLMPGIGNGRLQELSNSVKGVDYRFRYQYLTVPVLFNNYIKRSRNFKWSYYFSAGIGLNYLLKHEVKAKLDQFVVDGESTFHLDSTGYEGKKFAVNVFAGGRFEYKVDKSITVFAQPLLTFYPVSVSKTPMHVNPAGITVNCGLFYILDKDDK